MRAAETVLLAATLVFLLGRGSPSSAPATSTAVTTLPVDGNYKYDGVAWSGKKLVASQSRAGDAADEYRLVAIDPSDGSRLGERIPDRADCQRLDEFAPYNADGRLAWISNCLRREPGQRRIEVLTAPDLQGEVTSRAAVVTGYTTRKLDIHGSTILTSYGSRICETLGRLGSTAIEPVSIDVAGPGGAFNTGFTVGDVECSTTGIAILPATNIDGTLAFMASTRAIGKEGPGRLDTPFDLYLVPPGESVARAPGVSVMHPGLLTWTPNGEALLVSGRTDEGPGTWRIDPQTGQVAQVLDFALQSPSWSTEGDMLVAIRDLEGDRDAEFVIIETESLMAVSP